MREIRTSGSMSGDGKQGDAEWPKPLRPSSTLQLPASREGGADGMMSYGLWSRHRKHTRKVVTSNALQTPEFG